jgi:hypothetical protein
MMPIGNIYIYGMIPMLSQARLTIVRLSPSRMYAMEQQNEDGRRCACVEMDG